MELFALFGFVAVVVIGVVGFNLYKRPDWTRRKIAALFNRNQP